MPKSSETRVSFLPSRITPTIRATLVRRISPSGIMPIIAATTRGTASWRGSFRIKYCLIISRPPMGTSRALIARTSLFRSFIRTDLGALILRAVLVSLEA